MDAPWVMVNALTLGIQERVSAASLNRCSDFSEFHKMLAKIGGTSSRSRLLTLGRSAWRENCKQRAGDRAQTADGEPDLAVLGSGVRVPVIADGL